MTGLLEHGLNFKKRDVKKAKLNIKGGSDPFGHYTCEIPSSMSKLNLISLILLLYLN